MLISSKGRYALRLMIYIAAFGDEEGKIALREVSEREKISLKYLEQLVRPLMHAELLRSVRGKGGGYVLARPADEITAGDILRAAEGTTATVACDGLEGACTRADLCPPSSSGPAWRRRSTTTSTARDVGGPARAPEIHRYRARDTRGGSRRGRREGSRRDRPCLRLRGLAVVSGCSEGGTATREGVPGPKQSATAESGVCQIIA